MLRLLIPLTLGLVVGLGGTTGLAVMNAKRHAPAGAVPGDSAAAHADSAKTRAAVPASARAREAGAAPAVAAAPGEKAPGTAHGAAPAPAAGPPSAPPDSAAPRAAGPSALASALRTGAANAAARRAAAQRTTDDAAARVADTARERAANPDAPIPDRRLAKIFGAMQAKDAARVLEQMDDGDVHLILGFLGDRQAAAILSSFPPPRAAAIGRLALRTSRSVP